MRERSEEQPPKLKTYNLEMTLIKLFRNYTTSSSSPYPASLRHPPPPCYPYRMPSLTAVGIIVLALFIAAALFLMHMKS